MDKDEIHGEISNEYPCCNCGEKVELDYHPKMCCNGNDCGCLGLPIDPVLCKDCEIMNERVTNNKILKMFRALKGLSLVGLANLCGRSEKTIRTYELDEDLSRDKLFLCLGSMGVKVELKKDFTAVLSFQGVVHKMTGE